MEIDNEQDRSMLVFIFEALGYNKEELSEQLTSSHWKEIGFQQENPLTDFRSAGRLGLINLFRFIKENKELAKEMYRKSLLKENYYFFACGAINITHNLLVVLPAKEFNQLFGRCADVGEVVEVFQ